MPPDARPRRLVLDTMQAAWRPSWRASRSPIRGSSLWGRHRLRRDARTPGVLETRARSQAAPAGRPDGVDGVRFDDLALEQLDATTVTLKAIRGDVVKTVGTVTFPVGTFVGDYDAGRGYTPGNIIRYKSALWHCQTATALAPDGGTYEHGRAAGPQGKDCWMLLLRDGKRGVDGKHGATGPQGPPGADWQEVYDKTRRR